MLWCGRRIASLASAVPSVVPSVVLGSALAVAAVTGCSDPASFALGRGVQATVGPVGGVVELEGGYRLEFPPGALGREVEIRLFPLEVSGPDVLGGVRIDPPGLELRELATLTIPTAAPVEVGPRLAVAIDPEGADRFGPSGAAFEVDTDAGTAQTELGVLGGVVAHKPCLSAVRNLVLDELSGVPERGPSDLADIAETSTDALRSCDDARDPIQVMLSEHFTPCFEFSEGIAFSVQGIEAVEETVTDGRVVVMLLGPRLGGLPGVRFGMTLGGIVQPDDDGFAVRVPIGEVTSSSIDALESGASEVERVFDLETIDEDEGLRQMRARELYESEIGMRTVGNDDVEPLVYEHVLGLCEDRRF